MAAGDEISARARADDETSVLPTAILAHILSLLPLRSALLCGAVSRAWKAACREMLARATEFDFGPDFAPGMSPEQYSGTVDRAIVAHEAATLDSLKIFFLPGSSRRLQRRIVAWLEFAASRRVGDLMLDLLGGAVYDDSMAVSRIPGPTLHGRSLSRLSLTLCRFSPPLEPLELPSLQMISLKRVEVSDGLIQGLLSSCRALAELKLVLCDKLRSIRISSPPCLRSLTIIDCFELERVEIVAPSLKLFHFFGEVYRMELKDVSGVDDAFINMHRAFRIFHGYSQLDFAFLHDLRLVNTLTLCTYPLLGIHRPNPDWVDVFPMTFCSLKSLQLLLYMDNGLDLVCDFLHSCNLPVLESLFIECPDRCTTEEPLKSIFPLSKLKLVRIGGLASSGDMLKMAEFFLARAAGLETLGMSIFKMADSDEIEVLRHQLEALPRESQNPEILLFGGGEDRDAKPVAPHDELIAEIYSR